MIVGDQFISKRSLIILFSGIVLLFMAVILLSLKLSYRTQPQVETPTIIDQSISEKKIYSLTHQPDFEISHHEVQQSLPHSISQVVRQEKKADEIKNAASISPISVYEGTQKIFQKPNKTVFVKKPQYTIKSGTVLPATLLTGITSDLPGTIISKIRRSIYDTATGEHLLIPQGTTVVGTYDAQIAYGQQRAFVIWEQLIFPNGKSLSINKQLGVDLKGNAGLHDKVNNHVFRLFGTTMMFSLFSAAGQLSQQSNYGHSVTPQQVLFSSTGQQISQTGAQLLSKNLTVKPSIEIRPGTNFNILITKELTLSHDFGGLDDA